MDLITGTNNGAAVICRSVCFHATRVTRLSVHFLIDSRRFPGAVALEPEAVGIELFAGDGDITAVVQVAFVRVFAAAADGEGRLIGLTLFFVIGWPCSLS